MIQFSYGGGLIACRLSAIKITGNKENERKGRQMNYEIDFRNLNNNEKELVGDYIKENFDDLNLHLGYNYAIDVTDVVGRTANVDIFVA